MRPAFQYSDPDPASSGVSAPEFNDIFNILITNLFIVRMASARYHVREQVHPCCNILHILNDVFPPLVNDAGSRNTSGLFFYSLSSYLFTINLPIDFAAVKRLHEHSYDPAYFSLRRYSCGEPLFHSAISSWLRGLPACREQTRGLRSCVQANDTNAQTVTGQLTAEAQELAAENRAVETMNAQQKAEVRPTFES